MYRSVDVVYPRKLGLETALMKSFIGSPPLTPNPKGWAIRAVAPNTKNKTGRMQLVTAHRESGFRGLDLKSERFAQIDALDLGVAAQRLRAPGPEDTAV